jgi:hypothetical protein
MVVSAAPKSFDALTTRKRNGDVGSLLSPTTTMPAPRSGMAFDEYIDILKIRRLLREASVM